MALLKFLIYPFLPRASKCFAFQVFKGIGAYAGHDFGKQEKRAKEENSVTF
jgi:hypothetical protein